MLSQLKLVLTKVSDFILFRNKMQKQVNYKMKKNQKDQLTPHFKAAFIDHTNMFFFKQYFLRTT